MSNKYPPHHVPVLLKSVLEYLDPKSGESYLDLTAGYGGHAKTILELTGNYQDSVLVDRDAYAINHLSWFKDQGVKLIHQDFLAASKSLVLDNRQFDLILVDLGVSSPQLDLADRGFSFTNDGPLDMRMDQQQELSAFEVVNTFSKQELVNILVQYGEEKLGFSKRIADAIVKNRPIQTTAKLRDLVLSSHIGTYQKTNPATRTFQAIRIFVNNELDQARQVMPELIKLLKPNGRLAIISFHSLEDRIVKKFLQQEYSSGFLSQIEPITKKPILGATEDAYNPRSRSAKLRVARKK